ncbi:MAG: PilW family protein [Gammaproteobacteria bacterium]|nr:PilW family protein [Gammaproteobacteria bacterium]
MTRQPTFARRQAGISIVEIMIAMLLGLVLMGGILQVFASSRQTYRVHDAVSRMQESGRMALEVIGRDARMADFWGCLSETANVVNNLDNTGVGYIDFTAGGVTGTEGAAGAPDTLVFSGGVNSGLQIEPPYGPQASANLKVAPNNGLVQDQIIFVSDCSNADIFQISNANPNGSGSVVHNTGTGSPGNYNVTNPGCPGANAHCLSKVYGGDASIFAVQQITYTIGPGSEGQPALFRNGVEFIDGIENLQVLYGEDTDGSSVANYYVPANQVVDMGRVISIRFAVVARSYDDNLTDGIAQNFIVLGANAVAGDNRLRQVYTSTVTIRNRL